MKTLPTGKDAIDFAKTLAREAEAARVKLDAAHAAWVKPGKMDPVLLQAQALKAEREHTLCEKRLAVYRSFLDAAALTPSGTINFLLPEIDFAYQFTWKEDELK